MESTAALDRSGKAADAAEWGIDAFQRCCGQTVLTARGVAADSFEPIRRNVFSVVGRTVMTSLAVGFRHDSSRSDGASAWTTVTGRTCPSWPAHRGSAASEGDTVGHLLRMTAGKGYRGPDDRFCCRHPGDRQPRLHLPPRWWASAGSRYHYLGGDPTYFPWAVRPVDLGAGLGDTSWCPRRFSRYTLGIRNPQWAALPARLPRRANRPFSCGPRGLPTRIHATAAAQRAHAAAQSPESQGDLHPPA